MAMLALIWWLSAALAILAIVWMAWLILARLMDERAQARRHQGRQQLQGAFMAIVRGQADIRRIGAGSARLAAARNPDLIAEVLLEFLSLVKGPERERLLLALRACGLEVVLLRYLPQAAATEHYACVEALVAFPSDATVMALRRIAMSGASIDFRATAFRTLIALGHPPSLAELLGNMGGDNARQGGSFLDVVRKIGISDLEGAVAALSDPQLPGLVQAVLIEAIAAHREYQIIPLLDAKAADEVEPVRVAAIRAMGMLRHPACWPFIERALTDPSAEVRAVACKTAGLSAFRQAIPALGRCLSDSDWLVRFEAAEALIALGQAGVAELRHASAGTDDRAVRAASMALSEHGLADAEEEGEAA